MDYMDTDGIVDVPDTPERVCSDNTHERDFARQRKGSYILGHMAQVSPLNEEAKFQIKDQDNGKRRPLIRPPKVVTSHTVNEHSKNFASPVVCDSSPSRNIARMRRGVVDKASNDKIKSPVHFQLTGNKEPLCTSEVLVRHDGHERNGPSQSFRMDLLASSGNNSSEEIRRRAVLANGFSSSHDMPSDDHEAEAAHLVSSSGQVQPIVIDRDKQSKVGQCSFASLSSMSPRRVPRQKRLVRNGCISPHNIAKGKQLAVKDNNNVLQDGQNAAAVVLNSTSLSPIRVNKSVSEDHNSCMVKGKAPMNTMVSTESDERNTLCRRALIDVDDEVNRSSDTSRDACKRFEGISGWRSTRNRTRRMSSPLANADQRPLVEKRQGPSFVSQYHGNGVARPEIGSTARTSTNTLRNGGSVSSQHFLTSCARETAPHQRPRSGLSKAHHPVGNTLAKRQKHRPNTAYLGECSTSTSNDQDIVFLGSSGETPNLTSTSRDNVVGSSRSVIEIDDFSPEVRHDGPRCESVIDEDARARQEVADEMLARELQEQFYNEVPVGGTGEIDAHVAMVMQQESPPQALPRGSRHAINSHGSLMANLYRQSASRSSPHLPRRSEARASTSGRTRLRNRFPGQPRTLSLLSTATDQNSRFPPNMDVDMRMHILEALEAFNDMGVGSSFLHFQRDFNEDDYEMLLALDENNHQHVGASNSQINGLPQSTVQNDMEEACAVCLENPKMGETIRHLPCLHKFHKDCIDPWLRRRTSCPVCKSSVT